MACTFPRKATRYTFTFGSWSSLLQHLESVLKNTSLAIQLAFLSTLVNSPACVTGEFWTPVLLMAFWKSFVLGDRRGRPHSTVLARSKILNSEVILSVHFPGSRGQREYKLQQYLYFTALEHKCCLAKYPSFLHRFYFLHIILPKLTVLSRNEFWKSFIYHF